MHRSTLALLTALAAVGCTSPREPETRTYQLQGQVLAVRAESSEILVKHEDIKDFMPAMTMPYRVKDAALLKDRAPGDLITATLQVAPDLAWPGFLPSPKPVPRRCQRMRRRRSRPLPMWSC